MNDIITSLGSNPFALGIAALLTILLSLATIFGFVIRLWRFLREGGRKFSTNILAYRSRIYATAEKAAEDDAYLDALLWMKACRVITLLIAAGLCFAMRNMASDRLFAYFSDDETFSFIVSNLFSVLAIAMILLTVGTLYEISRIARIAVEKKDRLYFPDRYPED